MYKRDPIEDDPKFKEILAKAEAEAEEELKDERRGMGFCHLFWHTKKRILKEKYNVKWKSPADLNPHVMFD